VLKRDGGFAKTPRRSPGAQTTQDILSRMGAAACSLEPAEIKRMIDNLRDNVDSAIN
jgi:hypothetical protein